MALGWIALVLGAIGMVTPILPTTIFWIIALWAFTKSSPKMRRYLLSHPRFGKILRDWNSYRVVPRVGKIASGVSMGLVCALMVLHHAPVFTTVGVCFVLTIVFGYIVTRPSYAPFHSSENLMG